MTKSALDLTRLCSWYMNEMCHDLGLANQALHFDGEDAAAWVIVNEKEVRVLDGENLVAVINLTSTKQVEIIVPDNYRLIRSEALADYDPRHHGIPTHRIPDFKGDTEPDLIINCTLDEEPRTLLGPRQFMPRRSIKGKPTMRRQYDPAGR